MEPDLTYAFHAEMLRLALPLMARHRVPATPSNYGIWYAYVAGENEALKQRIDGLIAAQTPFTSEINKELYSEFGGNADTEKIDHIRGNLQDLMQDVNASLISADQQTDQFGGSLDQFSHSVDSKTPPLEVQALVGSLINDTQHMQAVTQNLQNNLQEKTQQIEALKAELEEERTRSRTDMMTKLANRAAFFETLDASLEKPDKERGELCLLMMDIDHFKRVNDKHGHLVGDRVIRFVANTIRKCIKGRDLAARFGGEEFTVLMEQTPRLGAKRVGHQIMAEISSAKLLRADTKQELGIITLSIGLAVYRPGEEKLAFIERADQALYQAKQKGRNRLCVEPD